MKKVLCIGGATNDIFLKTEDHKIFRIDDNEKRVEFLSFAYGKKIRTSEIHQAFGGGGNNVSVAFARFGLNVSFCGAVGDDIFAENIKKNLKKENVNIDQIQTINNAESGFSVILNSYEGDRTVLNFRGANMKMNNKNIDFNCDFLYFSHLAGKSEKLISKIIEAKKKYNFKIFWNPGSTQIKSGWKKYKEIIKNCSVIFLNKEEASAFVCEDFEQPIIGGKKCPECTTFIDEDGDGFPESIYNLEKIFAKFKKIGAKIIVITDSIRGTQVYYKDKIYYSSSTGTKPIDTLGAGDSFASAFSYGIMENKNIKTSLIYSAENSANVVNFYGAQKGILTKKELNKKVKTTTARLASKKFANTYFRKH